MRSSALLMAVLCLAGCRGGESDQPPIHLNPNMDTQEKGRPYRRDTSGLFADGRLMRTPVEGTVALGQLDEDDVLVEGKGPDGGFTTEFPASVTADAGTVIARGKGRYQIYCAPCHGVEGDGKGLVAARGLVVPPANFKDERLKGMSAGQMYSAIKNGVNNNNMASYAAQIPVEDRWAIIAYVRAPAPDGLGASGGVDTSQIVAQATASAAYGQLLYKAKICVTCHSLDGSKLVGPSLKGLFGKTESTTTGEVVVDDAYLKESIVQPMVKVVTGYPPAMPPIPLGDVEVDSLIMFIKEQK